MSGTCAGERFLVLLRGINVGGRHPVPMAALRRLFEEMGCFGVASYIQSGNLVATAAGMVPQKAGIEAALGERFGFPIPVAIRSRAEVDSIAAYRPFIGRAAPEAHWHCLFLPEPASPQALLALGAQTSGEEALEAHGREIFLYLPHGAGRSKLAAAVSGKALPAAATLRNWRTVLQLQGMLWSPSS